MYKKELLTEAEFEAIDMITEFYTHTRENVLLHGGSRDGDLMELAAMVHALQNWVMAQAAARAYPTVFRLAGE